MGHRSTNPNRGYLEPRPETPPFWQRGSWPLWLFFLAVFLIYLKDVPTILIMSMGGPDLLSPQVGSLLTISALFVLTLIAAFAAPGKLWANQLGLRGASPRQVLFWTVVSLVALYIPVYLGNLLSQSGSQDTTGLLGQGLLNNVCMVLTISIIGPVAEEFAYRAVLFRAASDGLARWFAPKTAAIIAIIASALVFMIAHVGAPPWQMLAYLAFGVALAVAYWYTGSLLTTLVPHLLNNTYAAVSLALSAQSPNPIVVGVALLSPIAGLALAFGLGRLLGWYDEKEGRR